MHNVILHLSLIRGVGAITAYKIINAVGSEQLPHLVHYSSEKLSRIAGISLQMAQLVCQGLCNQQLLTQELDLLDRHQIKIVTILDQGYPSLLKTIYAPPIVLYYRGVLPIETAPTIACVGSRDADAYGHTLIKRMVPELVQQGWHIVSGGAIGIDTYAHKETIAHGGKTTVVLGSGLLKLYPSENAALFEKVIDMGGAVCSPFSLTMGPLAGNFPARNRIIAGLSNICLVVQAARKSGALITAQFALEQGREVAVVPGPVTNEKSAGCHYLIQQGAALVTCVQDITDLAIGVTQWVKRPHLSKEIGSMGEQQPVVHNKSLTHKGFEEELQLADRIIALCMHNSMPIDYLVEKTGSSLDEVYDAIFNLNIDGKLFQPSPGLWRVSS